VGLWVGDYHKQVVGRVPQQVVGLLQAGGEETAASRLWGTTTSRVWVRLPQQAVGRLPQQVVGLPQAGYEETATAGGWDCHS